MNDANGNPYLRRSTDVGAPRNYCASDWQRLLWAMFFYEKTYSKDELAIYLNVAPDTVHAYANGELRVHVDTVQKIIQFIAEKNPKDTRLVDYFLNPAGYQAIPMLDGDGPQIAAKLCGIMVEIAEKYKKPTKKGEKR